MKLSAILATLALACLSGASALQFAQNDAPICAARLLTSTTGSSPTCYDGYEYVSEMGNCLSDCATGWHAVSDELSVCVGPCPNGYTQKNGECVALSKCPSTHQWDSTQSLCCRACPTGYQKYSDVCSSNCPSGYSPKDKYYCQKTLTKETRKRTLINRNCQDQQESPLALPTEDRTQDEPHCGDQAEFFQQTRECVTACEAGFFVEYNEDEGNFYCSAWGCPGDKARCGNYCVDGLYEPTEETCAALGPAFDSGIACYGLCDYNVRR